jgi:hypothetical protein
MKPLWWQFSELSKCNHFADRVDDYDMLPSAHAQVVHPEQGRAFHTVVFSDVMIVEHS